MATIITRDGKEYKADFSPPEIDWIQSLAECMGITKEAVLGAAINKGLTYYVESFRSQPEPNDKDKPDDTDTDDIC